MNNSRIRTEFKGSCLKQDKVTINWRNVVNLCSVYELDTWSRSLDTDFAQKDCLFGAVMFTKNADPDKYCYSGYGIGFHSCSLFSLSNIDWGNDVIFVVDHRSSVQIDHKKKDILVHGEGPAQRIDDTTIMAEARYFLLKLNTFCESLHYNANIFCFLMPQIYINSKHKTQFQA